MTENETAAVVVRWLAHGGTCRVVRRAPSGYVVELLSCDGEPMERVALDPADAAALDLAED